MTAQTVEQQLRTHRESLLVGLGVSSLSLFGSVARGTAAEESDVDILVDFDGPADFDRFLELKERLESLLGRPVDLVTRKALRPAFRPRIEREAIRVA